MIPKAAHCTLRFLIDHSPKTCVELPTKAMKWISRESGLVALYLRVGRKKFVQAQLRARKSVSADANRHRKKKYPFLETVASVHLLKTLFSLDSNLPIIPAESLFVLQKAAFYFWRRKQGEIDSLHVPAGAAHQLVSHRSGGAVAYISTC
jgi:hypothetical protein